MNVLLIDDNKSLTKAVSKALKIKGHQCTVSNNGREGLEIIQEQKFDKILLDLNMPEFSGYDVIDSLEKSGRIKEVKIIVFTAVSMSDDEIKELQNRGVTSVMSKIVKLDDFFKMIEV